jgi:hypothetical protein
MSVSYGGDSITFADGSVQSGGWTGMKNRIINGDMRIDQRNAGASISADDGKFAVDRFLFNMQTNSKGTGIQSTDAPPGFKYSLLYTNGSAYTVPSGDTFGVLHRIEGNNVFDLAWGTADAKAVTLSFWVKSSVTGTFGGALKGSYGTAYTYAFTYTINASNTWEYKTITIPGPTVGTWSATTGLGITISIGLGNGSAASIAPNSWTASNTWSATGAVSVLATAGATFQITGVQLERGSTASSFEYRLYGAELALCQRYYYLHASGDQAPIASSAFYYGSTQANAYISLPVTMRTTPSLVMAIGSYYRYVSAGGGSDTFTTLTIDGTPSVNLVDLYNNTEVSGTAGQSAISRTTNALARIAFSAEF